MTNLTGKVAIVTGSASGIGAATAETLAARGAAVVVADINGGGGREVASRIVEAGGSALAVEADVRDEAQVVALMDATRTAYGRLDILHNNAAAMETAGFDGGVVDQTLEVWEDTMAVDVRGPMWGCKHAIPLMLEDRGGSIINTSSISAQVGESGLTAYGVAKAGLSQLTRAVATQWGKSGIRCNAVAPGLVLTPSSLKLDPELLDIYLKQSLTPHLGEPRDIANLVAFLASDESRYITGQVINCDGGLVVHNGFVPEFNDWAARQPAAN
jgi:NAD(P)-dependent dehydrogenase (short-subunit alcohol dehydrogenase family)